METLTKTLINLSLVTGVREGLSVVRGSSCPKEAKEVVPCVVGSSKATEAQTCTSSVIWLQLSLYKTDQFPYPGPYSARVLFWLPLSFNHASRRSFLIFLIFCHIPTWEELGGASWPGGSLATSPLIST